MTSEWSKFTLRIQPKGFRDNNNNDGLFITKLSITEVYVQDMYQLMQEIQWERTFVIIQKSILLFFHFRKIDFNVFLFFL